MDPGRILKRPRELRRLHRYAVDVAASLSGYTVPKILAGRLTDINSSGCRIVAGQGLRERDFVMVKLPTFGQWGARVMWAKDDSIGLEFEQPLHQAVSQHIVQRYPAAA